MASMRGDAGAVAGRALPLSLLRIWCMQFSSWLSFTTAAGDRFLVGTRGYFVELPDGSLAAISPRTAFPVVDRFPSVRMGDLTEQSQFGRECRFVVVPESGARAGKPRGIPLADLELDLSETLPWLSELGPIEQYVALRCFESGAVSAAELEHVVRSLSGEVTVGQSLLSSGLISWEPLLAVCLDTRAPNMLDPPEMRRLGNRKEWERTGEILIAMGKINRTQLENALRIQREGHQELGKILTSVGACTTDDIEDCLALQTEVRNMHGAGVAMVGQLLVSQGIISPDDLEEALRSQKVARYSLERILISMGACTARDIEDFTKSNDWHHYQDEIDDIALGHWLIKVGTISRQQLDEALRVQMRGRQVLGELLVALKLCSHDDIEKVLKLQKDARRNFAAGVEKLGHLLIKQGKISADQLDEALALQSRGRQPIGCVLVALGYCRPEDITAALKIQNVWREAVEGTEDLLGSVLVADGVIGRETLAGLLPEHRSHGIPLGRLLIERDLATPERIIDTLLKRDEARRQRFIEHLRQHTPVETPPPHKSPPTTEIEASLLDRLSTWLLRRGKRHEGRRARE